jgi:amidase
VTDLHYASLGTVCARIKSGELSSREVTGSLLERIAQLDDALHAFVMVLGDRALARAAELDRARTNGEPLGPLHGVPIAVKDLLDMQGLPTACGTTVLADFVPGSDATVVERLEAAGAVIIGKTQLTEGAYGVHHPEFAAPVNPWDSTRWPGVSSSGSAVAVAAGLCYGAVGSDTGGSIRFPSASCGIVGLKPTYGRVSRRGVFPLAESLDHIGPMTRSVADAGRMLQVMAGRDPQDESTLDAVVPNYGAEIGAPIGGLKIGVDWSYVSEGVEKPVVDMVRHALAVLEGQGAVVREVTMPDSRERLILQWGITCAVECAQAHRNYYPAQKEKYGPALAELIEFGLNPWEGVYEELEEIRKTFTRELDDRFDEVACLIAPNMPYLPPLADGVLELSADPGRANGLSFTAPFDYSGHPTLSVPAGVTSDRLPLSFQLIGPKLGEPILLRVGSAFEAAAGFAERPID